MSIKRVDILQPLFERLKRSVDGEIKRGLIFGFPSDHSKTSGVAVAVALIHYSDPDSLKLSTRSLPYGLSPIGLVEHEEDECPDLYSAIDYLDNAILFKIIDGKVSVYSGADFLIPIALNVISSDIFWEKSAATFHAKGKFLLHTILESPDIDNCFTQAKIRVLNQSAYVLGSKESVTLLPRHGYILSESENLKPDSNSKVSDILKVVEPERKEYFRPGINLVPVQIYFDQTKSNSLKKATLLVSDKTARCKLFEYYLDIDFLVVVPVGLKAEKLYRKFNTALCNQLEYGFKSNINSQLLNSISADKPEIYHFWPQFAQHFITAVYPEQTSEEKLKDIRHELNKLFFIRETRPYFRRPAALFQPLSTLVSPHVGLRGKYNVESVIGGHYEYKHYGQDDFNDSGWGCAYRSLQTIVSWFRLQGFTSRPIPTHREIQECLVSLGDKPSSFIGSRQWIGSTEVAFVLEALLGVSSRIMNMSSGAEMGASEKVSGLYEHFKIHGTPVMVGGGAYAHTMIGINYDAASESDVQFLILDPHYTGADELKSVLSKGWVGWKEKSFWSSKDFYNVCMPLLPSSI